MLCRLPVKVIYDHSTLFDTIDSMLTNFVSSYARHCVEIVYKVSVRVLLVEEL